ncbi:MAG: hypothetical protein NC117_00755 [Pseudoflavonifractor sp.]|nr:hypothetical protein [Pseudoflavonifractor sp.]
MHTRFNDVVWRLLRHNIKPGQIAGYALANLVGLSIVLTALQFYRDVTPSRDDGDSFISRDYLILSRRVEGLGSMVGGNVAFSPADISDLEAQPWVRRVGRFTPSRFDVSASLEMGGRTMSTALFFESIPGDFFDVTPSGWQFDPSGSDSADPDGLTNPALAGPSGRDLPEIPIVLSKEYLTLYNFGFAASRGLPQLSEAMIGMVPLRVSVSGNGRQQYFPARIVGFSSRLNTIAVPEEFMRWANDRFADTPAADPSRLIVEVSSPGDPAIARYLERHGYESAGDKADNSRLTYFLRVVTMAVVTVGAVISLLALFILLLSIYLLLQRNRAKICDLMLLGYSPRQVAGRYCLIVAAVNLAVLVVSVVLLLCVRRLWVSPLASLGISPSSPWPVVGIGALVILAVTAVNVAAIARNVRGAFVKK